MALSVAVIGGGIIGCSIAYELAKGGCRVTVLERATPGAEASSAAAGLLAPLGESAKPDPFQELAVASWRLYPGVVAELRDVTGVDVEHMTAGTLYPITSAADRQEAAERCGWPLAREFGVRILEGAELYRIEPALSREITAALFVQGDHWVNNQRLVTAYAAAAAGRGVEIRTGLEVSEIALEGRRVRGVLVDGERIDVERVVLAAGAWCGGIAARGGLHLPVGPVRGQMLAVSNVPPLLTHAIHGPNGYLTPRPSGELLIGATVEHVGFTRAVTPDGFAYLLAGALATVPDIGRRAITRSWCGFRPWAPDSLPVLGPWPGIDGLYVATGHYRNGILLAPATASLMSRCILAGETPTPLKPFLPDRFVK
ncbi:MAG TPA: glycine oxidase ThiO [Methylomirabilota bacterium]|nr:glycine oxidase ThiO [Methylomirabilota bacterium]